MLILLLIILLQTSTQQTTVSTLPADGSLLRVLSAKWIKTRISIKKAQESGVSPVRAVIPQNKNFQRNSRVNDPVGVRDPNADTLDGRSAEMEKMVQESRSPQTDLDGFTYTLKVHNDAHKNIEIIFWEYQFPEVNNPDNVARRQFLCGVDLRAGKEKELEGFSLSGPNEVVSVGTLADKSASDAKGQAIINRVEYSDGSIWQRGGWHLNEVKASYDRVMKERWTPGMCKAL